MIVSFRPETAEDEAFLRRLITFAVSEELGAGDWPEPMRSHLVGLQYAARRRRALDRYPHGESRIIVVEGAEAGWLFTATLPDMVWLVEILVLPEFRGRGAGSLAIRRLIDRAAPVPVRLNVNLSNTGAARLYRRLGFHALESDGVQLTMEFRP